MVRHRPIIGAGGDGHHAAQLAGGGAVHPVMADAPARDHDEVGMSRQHGARDHTLAHDPSACALQQAMEVRIGNVGIHGIGSKAARHHSAAIVFQIADGRRVELSGGDEHLEGRLGHGSIFREGAPGLGAPHSWSRRAARSSPAGLYRAQRGRPDCGSSSTGVRRGLALKSNIVSMEPA